MKLTLKDVMTTLRIECKADGYELHSPAGIAYYDLYGARNRVNGVPEYFPLSLAVHVNADNRLGKLGGKDGGVSVSGAIHLQANDIITTVAEQAIQATARAEELSALKVKTSDAYKSLTETIREAIAEEKKPGGLIYEAFRGRL